MILFQLKNNYNLKFKDNGWFIINDKIEGVCDGAKDMLKYQPEKIGEYYVQNINEYYHYLLNSGREKDKQRIFEGSTFFTSIRYFTLATKVVVLPVPAPAII